MTKIHILLCPVLLKKRSYLNIVCVLDVCLFFQAAFFGEIMSINRKNVFYWIRICLADFLVVSSSFVVKLIRDSDTCTFDSKFHWCYSCKWNRNADFVAFILGGIYNMSVLSKKILVWGERTICLLYRTLYQHKRCRQGVLLYAIIPSRRHSQFFKEWIHWLDWTFSVGAFAAGTHWQLITQPPVAETDKFWGLSW